MLPQSGLYVRFGPMRAIRPMVGHHDFDSRGSHDSTFRARGSSDRIADVSSTSRPRRKEHPDCPDCAPMLSRHRLGIEIAVCGIGDERREARFHRVVEVWQERRADTLLAQSRGERQFINSLRKDVLKAESDLTEAEIEKRVQSLKNEHDIYDIGNGELVNIYEYVWDKEVRCYQDTDWVSRLPYVELAMNDAKHDSTGWWRCGENGEQILCSPRRPTLQVGEASRQRALAGC
jgi:hypothetical protein